MAIPVNIEDLLHKCKIESTRIEFKTGCNPNKIYRTICVFADDFDNIGRGYITVGVQEEKNTGIAQRPVTDVPIEEFDKIQRDMIGFNHKIEPLNDAINNNARLVLLAISRTPFIKRKFLLDNIDISKATLERILKQLSSEPLGLVEYQGSLKTGGYVLTEKGKSFVESMND